MSLVNFTMLVHNRPKLTEQALVSLGEHDGATVTVLGNKVDPELWESIDNWRFYEGHNATRALLHNSFDDGTGDLRNQVIRHSEYWFGRGDYLYLSDNDVFFKPGWLEALIKCYEVSRRYGFKVIGAYNHPYHQPIPGEQGVCLPRSLDPIVISHAVNPVHALALQSMIMTWDIWDKYGPFCKTEPGRVCQSEDVDFTNKIVADGGKIGVVSPALIVNTGLTNSFGEKIPGYDLVKSQVPPGVLAE